MALQARCPECSTSYALSAAQAGKKVRCKKCSAVFVVEDEDREESVAVEPKEALRSSRGKAVARPQEVEDEDEERPVPRKTRKEAKKGPPATKEHGVLLGLVGGGLVLLLLLGGGGYLIYRSVNKTRLAKNTSPSPAPGPGEQARAPVYATPQECFDALAQAEKTRDHKTYVTCLAPQSQRERAGELALGSLGRSAPKNKDAEEMAKMMKPVSDVLDKHGLTEQAVRDIPNPRGKGPQAEQKAKEVALLPLIKDPAAFVVDWLTGLDQAFGSKGEKAYTQTLTDVKIDGDRATGTVVTRHQFSTEKSPATFVKLDGGWRMLYEPKPLPVRNEEPKRQIPTPLVEWPAKGPVQPPERPDKALRVIVKGKVVQTIRLFGGIRERTLEAWVTVSNINQRGGQVLSIDDGREHWDGILYADADARRWYPGSSYRHRSNRLTGPEETAGPAEPIHLVMVYASDSSVTLYRNGQIYGAPFVPRGGRAEVQTYPADTARLRIGADMEGNTAFQGDVKEARLYNRALNPLQVTALYNSGKERLARSVKEVPKEAPPVVPAPLTTVDLAPGGLFLTIKAPAGVTVGPWRSGVVVRKGEEFRLLVRPDEDGKRGDLLMDVLKKQLPPSEARVVINTEDIYLAGIKGFMRDSFQFIVKVKVGGKPYLCMLAREPGADNPTEAQAVLMVQCARSLTQTEANKQAEARMNKAVARFEEVGCDFKSDTSLVLEGARVSDADLALLKDLPQIGHLTITAEKLTPAGLKHLHEMPNLYWVQLEGKVVTDAWLGALRRLRLRRLKIYRTSITSAGWQHFQGLTVLEELHIGDQPVADAALQHLGGLPKLSELNLWKTGTTDAGLRHLGAVKSLMILEMSDVPATDAGLEHLRGLNQMFSLTLTNTKVTAAGAQKLRKALPKCEVRHRSE